MLQTALHDWHAAHHGRMVDFAGWHMPIQYSSIVDEHHAVRQRVGLFDIAHMGRLWFRGPEQIKLLDHVLTNHVAKMKPGQVRYSLVCREDGGILDDVLIYRFEEDCLLVVNGANREKIVSWISAHQSGFDAAFTDTTTDTFMFALQGPQAQGLLQPHADCDLATIRYYNARKAAVFGVPAVISRTGYTGEDGFEVIVDNSHAVDAWEKVMAAGSAAGIAPCGLGCRDTLRLEAAMPLYGHEMDETVDPFTANLSFGVKLDKPDFIGKTALTQLADKDDLPRRVGLQLDGKRIARQGAEVYFESQKVGIVTSGTFSPTLEISLAMASVAPQVSEPGGVLEIDIRGRREPARVVALPFYKRK
ncbi:glycine cleavage system aminomethyltransferase GcvT [Planctomicrobium piriforme]|uniref:Aminomethyltransferase n=1 Tax=Planctomicrobium piriforme TaxID=1576369 RepID=A0A1I3GIX6_9PLAN|nr:glycine cleavage system aminomethyltransferase GcvT [Planctomicrobium piriforme]SFI23416.1 aminomethyltransferase [Planctomicrobium piriforme]